MTRVIDLLPGDLVRNGSMSAVYVAQTTHPIWPELQLVIWRMPDGSWSHDALSPIQDIGEADPLATKQVRKERLRDAFFGARS